MAENIDNVLNGMPRMGWSEIYKALATEFDKANPNEAEFEVHKFFSHATTLGGELASDTKLAMDNQLQNCGFYDTWGQYRNLEVDGAKGLVFPGYGLLSILEQNPLIRTVVETITNESTRKWCELRGADADNDELERLTRAIERYDVKDIFKEASLTTGFQGGCMVYIDVKGDDPEDPLILRGEAAKRLYGKTVNFVKLDPVNCYPAPYNTINPLDKSYFEPTYWYVITQKVHRSRLIQFRTNKLNIFLRPAYNFFGISLSQLILPYVRNFERARDASARTVNNFSLLWLKTDLMQTMQPGNCPLDDDGNPLPGYAGAPDVTELVNKLRFMLSGGRNYGIAAIQDGEELGILNMPLTGLADLVSQTLELLALVSGTPITKLFGSPPKGLNATGEHDQNNFYDRVQNWQERMYHKQFEKARRVIEYTEFGRLHEDIKTEWLPLKDPNPREIAEIRSINAAADATLINTGVIDAEDAATRLSQDPQSGYEGLDDKRDERRRVQAARTDRLVNFHEGAETRFSTSISTSGKGETTETETVPSTEGAATTTEEVFNGTQMASLRETVAAAYAGGLPEEAVRGMLKVGLKLTDEQLDIIFRVPPQQFNPNPESVSQAQQ